MTEKVGDILDEIQPSTLAQETVERRRAVLVDILGETLQTQEVRHVGSHTRGTALHSSDADFLCIIPRKQVRKRKADEDSTRIVRAIIERVRERYPHTDVSPDGQAVVVAFDDGTIDIVPAVYVGPVSDNNGYPLYRIPDGSGGWMETSPDTIGRFLAQADEATRGRLKAAARGIKSWRKNQAGAETLKGLWIELSLAHAQQAPTVGLRRTEYLTHAFEILYATRLDPAPDPSGVAQTIPACAPGAKEKILGALAAAAQQARDAAAMENTDPEGATRKWRQLLLGGAKTEDPSD